MLLPGELRRGVAKRISFCFEVSFGWLRRRKKGIRSRKERLENKQDTVGSLRAREKSATGSSCHVVKRTVPKDGFISTNKYEQQRRPSNGSRAPFKCIHQTKGCSYGHGFVVRRKRRYKVLISLAGA